MLPAALRHAVFFLGILMYLLGVLLVFPRYLLGLEAVLKPASEWIVWYSGIPIVNGIGLALFDLLFMLDRRRSDAPVRYEPIAHPGITVALTAYNDQDSIAEAVRDFQAHPLVRRVIVVSNNSSDATFARAEAAGAITFNEQAPGYGRCVYRCLREAIHYPDSEIVVLCEGDLTFRAHDIDKFLAYAPHGDVVNGTRTAELLRQYRTQLTTFMYYGNVFVGKMLEAKHLGRSTITDVGTTYKLCRRDALAKVLPKLDPGVEPVITGVTDLAAIADGGVDFAFASNLFEHISQADFAKVLAALCHKLAPGGTLNILQPNYRYAFREYFDDYTHVAIYSHDSLTDFLTAHSYEVLLVQPRFLPLTVKSRLPVSPALIALYLKSPVKPMGKQMLARARPRMSA